MIKADVNKGLINLNLDLDILTTCLKWQDIYMGINLDDTIAYDQGKYQKRHKHGVWIESVAEHVQNSQLPIRF